MRARGQPKEEEEEGDGTVSGCLVAATQLAHEWVEVSSLPLCCLSDLLLLYWPVYFSRPKDYLFRAHLAACGLEWIDTQTPPPAV